MARRPEATHSGRPERAPYTEAPAAYTAVRSPTRRQAEPTPATLAAPPPHYERCLSFVNFDGHFVTSESRSAMNVPRFSSPETITSRPSRNGSGTTPV